MKIFFSLTLFLLLGTTFGQSVSETQTPFQTIHRIFSDYLNNKKNTDSKENKDSMENSLKTLQHSSVKDELYLLINVWMYYTPSDFPTKELVTPIFFANKLETITQIKVRMKNRWVGEKRRSGPFSELIKLKNELSESTKIKD